MTIAEILTCCDRFAMLETHGSTTAASTRTASLIARPDHSLKYTQMGWCKFDGTWPAVIPGGLACTLLVPIWCFLFLGEACGWKSATDRAFSVCVQPSPEASTNIRWIQNASLQHWMCPEFGGSATVRYALQMVARQLHSHCTMNL